jgi:hypothetical protein
MSAAPKAGRQRAKKARGFSCLAGPVPILFGVACVVAFVGAVALIPVSDPPRPADAALTAGHTEAAAPSPPKPRAKSERPQITPAPPLEAKKRDTAAPASTAPVEQVASVTITGCLEHDDETFWLKDASGADTPMGRSWKSGFLKKRPSRIELIDAQHTLPLTSYVGHRVSATGTINGLAVGAGSVVPGVPGVAGASCAVFGPRNRAETCRQINSAAKPKSTATTAAMPRKASGSLAERRTGTSASNAGAGVDADPSAGGCSGSSGGGPDGGPGGSGGTTAGH